MGQIYAISRNTFLEAVRQPVYGLTIVVSCCLIAVSPVLAAHIYTFGAGSGLEKPAERMIADLGLATMLLSGLILAVFATSSVICREIQDKTALTVLSKKVSRTAFVLGKYVGVSLAIAVAAITNLCVILMTLRVGTVVSVNDPIDVRMLLALLATPLVAVVVATLRNYFRGRAWVGSFTITFMIAMGVIFALFALFDKNYTFIFAAGPIADAAGMSLSDFAGNVGITYDWEVAKAGLLTLEAVLLVAGISVAASTRLDTGGNFLVSACVFLSGLTSEYFYGLVLKSEAATVWLTVANTWYSFVPNLQIFWMSDAITREHPIPWAYIGSASTYALCYVGAVLFLAAFLFQKREVS